VKALSLWQPWATLVAIGAKTLETRGWPSSYGGPLAIHAGATHKGDYLLARDAFSRAVGLLQAAGLSGDPADLPRGGVVAVCVAAPSTQVDRDGRWIYCGGRSVSSADLMFGDFSLGRHVIPLSQVRPLPAILPYRGGQRWFYVPDELIARAMIAPSQSSQPKEDRDVRPTATAGAPATDAG